ncbi:MAG: Gldg family protein [Acetobacterium sp.]
MSKLSNWFNHVLKSKSLKYGSNSIVLIIAVIAIAVLVNLLAEQSGIKFDLTANQLYSIGDTTKTIINELDKEVVIYGLMDDGKLNSDQKNVQDLLNKYANYSKSQITVKYVDPDKDTTIINQLDSDGLLSLERNDYVVTSGNKSKKLTNADIIQVKLDQQSLSQYSTGSIAEQGFTGAIKYVVSDITPTIYFVEGHGEEDLAGNYKTTKENLEKNNYLIKSINLEMIPGVPEDASMLVFLSPQKDLSTNESNTVTDFLQNGGNAAFLFDFIDSDPSFTEFESIIKGYNLALNDDRVREDDAALRAPNDPYALILDVGSSKIIPLEFSGMLMINSRSIAVLKNDKPEVEVTPLVISSETSIGEQVNKDNGKDNQGPLNLAVAVDNRATTEPSKILVLGSTLFLSDSAKKEYPPYYATGTYFIVSAVNWMQDNSDDVVIGAKSYSTGKMGINNFTANMIGFVVILVMPLIILGYGFFVWRKRRNS